MQAPWKPSPQRRAVRAVIAADATAPVRAAAADGQRGSTSMEEAALQQTNKLTAPPAALCSDVPAHTCADAPQTWEQRSPAAQRPRCRLPPLAPT